jgi:hypothetical protein
MAVVTSMVIAGTALAVGAYGAVKQAEEAKKMRKNAEAAAALQYTQQQQLIDEQKKQDAKAEKDKADAAQQVRNEAINSAQINRRNRGALASQKQDVLTSPLGVVSQANTAGKTALGT